MMPDSRYIIEERRRIRKATKVAVMKRGNIPFTTRDIIPRVKKQLWSYERWNVSTQRIAQALRHLYLEGLVEKVGFEERKRYPATIYRLVGDSFN
jgi:DNA-binding PadR family transcriptional regulator